jgi:single-stranded-DNA-specific exonuclease
MKARAFELVDALHFDGLSMPAGLCLYDKDWHQGVVGIVASRVKEKFHRPVIAFAQSDRGMIKGSGRSVSGLHMRDALEAIAIRRPGLIERFGGHAMAAGLSIAEENFSDFCEVFEQQVSTTLDPALLTGTIESDGELTAEDFSLDVAELLRNCGPWGQGFPEPQFDGDFTVLSQRILGDKHLKLVVCPVGSDHRLDAIAFFQAQDHGDLAGATIRMAFSLDSNEYRGLVSLQLRVELIEKLDTENTNKANV